MLNSTDRMIVVSYGGGTNSTAMLVGMHERGIRPDIILFADTGGEKPHTYEHIEHMQGWLEGIGFPQITIVRNEAPSRHGGLENYCLHHKALPSIAYGFKQCSLQFKKEPQDKYIKDHGITDFERWIGFDADEPHRAERVKDKDESNKKFEHRYPLIEWNWGRDECVEAIRRAGLPQPGKSSCYFCPSSKVQEIKWLARNHPDLAARAIAMEENAQLTHVKGLGRNFSWKEVIEYDRAQLDFLDESHIQIDCGCYDGDA